MNKVLFVMVMLTLAGCATTEQVDLAEGRKQFAARQIGKEPGRTPASPPNGISAAETQTLTAQATQGNAEAQVRLGWMYAFGEGVPQDYPTARKWWENAATQGDVVAQDSLGELYADGRGGAQDYSKARTWWEKSAAQGNAVSQIRLGALYEMGYGVPQDFVRAHMWYNVAGTALSGDLGKTAMKNRDSIASRMTVAQIEKAQERARRCQETKFKECD